MKGNEKIIEALNNLLAEELTAINQYMVHSEMCHNWGYNKLHKSIEARAFKEMKHAEILIERILFLEGMPIVSNLMNIHIGTDVEKQFQGDLHLEHNAVKMYNDSIKLATELSDNGTSDFLQQILNDEEEHVDEIETQLEQISQMGLQNYLSDQI
ncbi:MAG: bacterioferritin [Acidobacteria bacterium]|jgi:bacterioferritin|nr:bacterioferritin [Acidobacteriota bacterium]